MSENPRHESNSYGKNRPARKNHLRAHHQDGQGFKGSRKSKGRPGNKGGFNRDERRNRDVGKRFSSDHNGRNTQNRNRGPESETPREEVRTIGGRAGYRPSKSKIPDIDSDVTGRELDRATNRQLGALEPRNAENVAKHLVMAGRYLEIDPQFALEHAVAASRSAGRIGAVREAVGVAAYVAEDYEMALRELRTHRRISGSNEHIALLVDCERALGRLPKAIEMIDEAKREELDSAARAELAIVESGIYTDQGKKSQAVAALEIPQLNPKLAYDYSPRLFGAYAEALANAGRVQEAQRWERLAHVAEAALGQGDYEEPEIFDMYGEADLFEPEEEADTIEHAGDDAHPDEAAGETTQAEDNKTENTAAAVTADTVADTEAATDDTEHEHTGQRENEQKSVAPENTASVANTKEPSQTETETPHVEKSGSWQSAAVETADKNQQGEILKETWESPAE